jgi:hypothetical protein
VARANSDRHYRPRVIPVASVISVHVIHHATLKLLVPTILDYIS